MNLLFVHNGEKVKFDTNGHLYTDGSYNQDVWDRYHYLSENISVLMRKDPIVYSEIEAKTCFNLIDQAKISFIKLPDTTQSIITYINPKVKMERKRIMREKISEADMVIVRTPGSDYAVQEALAQRKPLIVEAVGCPFDSLWNHSLKGKLLAFQAMRRMKDTIRKAPYVIYVTEMFLQSRYPTGGKSVAISDVVIEDLEEEILEARIKKILNKRKGEKIVLGSLGAVNIKYKGHRFVLEALTCLRKRASRRYVYQIAGGGSQEYIRGLVTQYGLQDDVKILGSIPHAQVSQWLDGLDIYVQPSLTEGLPRAVVEAMSRALPCIGSNVGGIPELIDSRYLCEKKAHLGVGLSKIISELTVDEMVYEAKCNFEKAMKYTRSILDSRRKIFYDRFLEENGLNGH